MFRALCIAAVLLPIAGCLSEPTEAEVPPPEGPSTPADPVAAGRNATEPQWAPASEAALGPGTPMGEKAGAPCVANFVFWSPSNGSAYLGARASCFQEAPGADSCNFGTEGLGKWVDIEGAQRWGQVAYSSYASMARLSETDSDICAGNDFALIRLDPLDHTRTTPSVGPYGGPTGLPDRDSAVGEPVLLYGRQKIPYEPAGQPLQPPSELDPREGIVVATQGAWQFNIHTLGSPALLSPGAPVLAKTDGAALGLTTGTGGGAQVSPGAEASLVPASSEASSIALAVVYAREAGFPVELATSEFTGGI